jgi:hypothetical protein
MFSLAFFQFFSVVSPLCAFAGQLLFGQHQVMSVICFPFNEIRAKARSRKKKQFPSLSEGLSYEPAGE